VSENLIGNAIKYLSGGGAIQVPLTDRPMAEVAVRLRRRDLDRPRAGGHRVGPGPRRDLAGATSGDTIADGRPCGECP
jgi:hypothetical protein